MTPRRGGLAIDVAVVGHPLADGAVTADPQGGVRMSVPTSAGPLELLLPALPLLVAAAEATNDDVALRLWGTDIVGADVVVQVPADTARAAADAARAKARSLERVVDHLEAAADLKDGRLAAPRDARGDAPHPPEDAHPDAY